MPRERIWNFHHARLSLVQSCLRELIGCAQSGVSASAWAGQFSCGRAGLMPAARAPGNGKPGLRTAQPLMRAAGSVLSQIDRHVVADAGAACSAFQAARSGDVGSATGGALGLPADCMDLVAQHLFAWVFRDEARRNEVACEFKESPCDPGWLAAVDAWLAYYADGKPPQYIAPGADSVPMALPSPAAADGMLRVGLIADWGTGEPEAIAVLDQLMLQRPDVVIHLGDIYYAGTADECRQNFLDPIEAARQKHGSSVPVYALPGNHDYYSGGKAYYAMLQELNRDIKSAPIQTHSFFCLRNDRWQLEGMDTGYYDSDLIKAGDDISRLRDDEAAWHQEQLQRAGGRQVILLSHHQLYSAFLPIGRSGRSFTNPYLTDNLRAWRAAGATSIAAWLWGHEHMLEVYAAPGQGPNSLPVLGRCIGNGAFPVFINSGDYAPQAKSPIPLQPAPAFPHGYVQTADDELAYANGYALLTLGPAASQADYYEVLYDGSLPGATSRLIWSERLGCVVQ